MGLWTAGISSAATDPGARCIDRKLGATARHARSLLACHARALQRGNAVAATCLQRADDRLSRRFANAERRPGCLTVGDAGVARRLSEGLVDRALSVLVSDPAGTSRCTADQLRAGGLLALRTARAHGLNVKRGGADTVRLASDLARAREFYDRIFSRGTVRGDCQSATDGPFAAVLFESGLDAAYGALKLVDRETVSIPSAAQPAETPGTPGVDASVYGSLVAQFGGAGFDLNNATYTRYFYRADDVQPDAILVLIPGFEGGGASFQILAENLVTRGLENGRRLELWAVDRRGNQMEDRAGFAIAVENGNAQTALDWYFGAELGLPLDPALAAGPNRRVIFHNPQEQTAFMANWTSQVFSQDIDAVVEAASGVATNGNVFLGGHSAGTGYTARYASTDFDFSGAGPAQPGFEKLRGLVLLEGGGGSAGGPLDSDELDRIEDRADGGLFFAVRDDAPRCVDGTPCTLATEAIDCAALGNGTCTEPTPAYAIIPGLLNPRIFAASEPGALQALEAPDSDQVIIQVDQGAPGNNAISAVPDLASLGLLPQATAEGALGSFLDDDGFVSSFASFVSTSVGAPGPTLGGLVSWQDATEGPFDPSVIPDNGPPSPTFAGLAVWGQEREISRIDRVGLTFVNPTSNFSDWYYPSAGVGVTSGVGLDSSQLSAGRGRRDIVNLTQAGDVDIPVICFGGTNGLTRAPGVFTSFAQTIGDCAATSCDGTPRVVDALNPSETFPTFGDLNGGFEVHMSEGYAHVDIVTAEDDADNQVVGPLLDFIERNLQ
ncbi:MAG: hypothetical protein JRG83_09020 [Deltaproteobacteria bacterium]|nr:hypothetical protein [Deltaproteobacteria bacterium]